MVVLTTAGNRSRCVSEQPDGLSEHRVALSDLASQALPFNTTSSAD